MVFTLTVYMVAYGSAVAAGDAQRQKRLQQQRTVFSRLAPRTKGTRRRTVDGSDDHAKPRHQEA